MPIWAMMTLQNSNSPLMEMISFFYDYVSMTMVLILGFVLTNAGGTTMNKLIDTMFWDSNSLENFWLAMPIMVLMMLGLPSISNLYLAEEVCNPDLTFKVTGSQWFWTYSSEVLQMKEFDSNMIKSNLMRLLCTDNQLILPTSSTIRFLITSNDVIHSWTIPSLGIKVDAIPGRINQTFTIINRPGVYVGQCSEICGLNHSFMPIVMSSIPMSTFINSL